MRLRLQHAGGAVRVVTWLQSDLKRKVLMVHWPLAGQYELHSNGKFLMPEKASPQQQRNLKLWTIHPADMKVVRKVFGKQKAKA